MKSRWIGGAIAVLIAVIAAIWYGVNRPGPEIEVAAPVPDATPEAPVVESVVVEAPVAEVAESDEAAPNEAEGAGASEGVGEADTVAEDTTTTTSETSAATFDIVRVEPDGETVIAGRATPGTTMILMMDGVEVGRAETDAVGNFVALLSLGASDGPRVMSLVEVGPDGQERVAEASVILAPSPRVLAEANGLADEAQGDDAAAADTDAGDEMAESEGPTTDAVVEVAEGDSAEPELNVADAGEDATEGDDAPTDPVVAEADADSGEPDAIASLDAEALPDIDEPAVADVPAPEATDIEPAAPTVLLADRDGVRVLQAGGDGPEVVANVSIDAISYDSAGEVALSGRSTGDSSVRVYLDNEPILDADIGDGGQWRADLPEIDTGTYTLRVDELDDTGAVVSRTETPFRREPVAAIRALDTSGGTQAAPVALITVQPGNTLWGIAREKYGEGLLYVRVFEANADRIRDADLIYPGQIFTVPN